MINLNCLTDRILYHILQIIFKKHGEKADNPSVRIYVNKVDNRIKFKIKTGCNLKLLTRETIKLLGGTKSKITKDKNGENISNLDIVLKYWQY